MKYLDLACIDFLIYTLVFYIKKHTEATYISDIFLKKIITRG
jgi:hypothetical protein